MEFTRLNGEKIPEVTGVSTKQLVTIVFALVIAMSAGLWLAFNELSFPVASVTEKPGPRATIERLDWFEDTAAKIYRMERDIIVYEDFLKRLRDSYGDKSPQEWAVNERDQFFTWSEEVISLKRKNDELARQYNAEMTEQLWKIVNWIQEAKAKVKPIPPKFTVYDVPPATSNLPSKW